MDAAYVPVAVARECKTEPEKCKGDEYRILPIAGNYGNKDSGNQKDSIQEARQIVDSYNGALARKRLAQKDLLDAQKNLEDVEKAVAAKEKELSTSQGVKTELDAKAKDGNTPSELQKASKQVDDLTKDLTELQSKRAKAVTVLDGKKGDLAARENELDQLPISKVLDAIQVVATESMRQDSYSVFGSFSANTSLGVTTSAPGSNGTGAASAAGVTLGKVFSTGVAAQQLTDGIASFYRNASMAYTIASRR